MKRAMKMLQLSFGFFAPPARRTLSAAAPSETSVAGVFEPPRPQRRPRQLTRFKRPDDPQLPVPDLRSRWCTIRAEYFPLRADIDDYKLVWSTGVQKTVLASCNVHRRRIRVAASFQRVECMPYLDALLYHEMCHAVLGEPPRVGGRRVVHGKEFRALEARHPGIPALDRWIEQGGWRDEVRRHRRTSGKQKPRPRVKNRSARRRWRLI